MQYFYRLRNPRLLCVPCASIFSTIHRAEAPGRFGWFRMNGGGQQLCAHFKLFLMRCRLRSADEKDRRVRPAEFIKLISGNFRSHKIVGRSPTRLSAIFLLCRRIAGLQGLHERPHICPMIRCRTSTATSALRPLSSAGGLVSLLPSASQKRILDMLAFSFRLCPLRVCLTQDCSCASSFLPATAFPAALGRELEHQANLLGLALAEGEGLVEDFGPLGRVPVPPFWLVSMSPSCSNVSGEVQRF